MIVLKSSHSNLRRTWYFVSTCYQLTKSRLDVLMRAIDMEEIVIWVICHGEKCLSKLFCSHFYASSKLIFLYGSVCQQDAYRKSTRRIFTFRLIYFKCGWILLNNSKTIIIETWRLSHVFWYNLKSAFRCQWPILFDVETWYISRISVIKFRNCSK